jgi:hypothetical protein
MVSYFAVAVVGVFVVFVLFRLRGLDMRMCRENLFPGLRKSTVENSRSFDGDGDI